MNTTARVGSSLLGLVSGLVAHAQDSQALASHRALSNLESSKLVTIEVDSLIGNTCYGRPCPETELNNCEDAAIESNLKKLNTLNIVNVNSLAAFACTGYCFEDSPEGRLHDKCEKAEALAQLVKLAAPLKVSIKH